MNKNGKNSTKPIWWQVRMEDIMKRSAVSWGYLDSQNVSQMSKYI